MKIIIIILFITVALGCNNTSRMNRSEEAPPVAIETVGGDGIVLDSITEIDSASATLPSQSVIEVRIPAETLPVTKLRRAITNDRQSVHVQLTDLDVGLLRVELTHSRPDANVRTSQIIKPDGSMDGPFGRQLTLDIKQRGDYILIINKSNMASGTQVGDLFLTIER
ncbi:hypothetical protein ABDK00_014905 [Niabella insulamsoli]|uniref:hypothetical protein n=1 Tax=Niabella insulamsoli TaxID=3144874 RepID=UPI0031FC4473